MKNTWIIPVAALAVGAAGGYISGKGSGDGKTAGNAVEEAKQRLKSSSRTSSTVADGAKKVARGSSIEEIARIPGNSNRIQALLEFYAGLTPEQLAEEAGKLESLPVNERIMASVLLFGQWAEKDPQAAMAYSNTMGFAGAFVRPTILQSWASVDPSTAAKYYAENPREFAMMGMMGGGRGPMGGGQNGASIIASEWARQDPAAALNWASGLGADKVSAMNSVIGEVAKTDPAAAAGMIAKLDPESRTAAYETVATQYGASNFADAQVWIRTLPADQQAAALSSAIEGLSSKDPVVAAQQLKLMPDGDAKNGAVDDVVRALARTSPQDAADLIKSFDDERAQRNGLGALMGTWVSQDAKAAETYALSLPQGRVQDSALQPLIWGNNSSSPTQLLSLASNITDEGDRTRTEAGVYMRWMREDPDAAKSAIQSSSLPQQLKENLSEGRGMWGGGPGGSRGGGPGNRGGGRRGGGGGGGR